MTMVNVKMQREAKMEGTSELIFISSRIFSMYNKQ